MTITATRTDRTDIQIAADLTTALHRHGHGANAADIVRLACYPVSMVVLEQALTSFAVRDLLRLQDSALAERLVLPLAETIRVRRLLTAAGAGR